MDYYRAGVDYLKQAFGETLANYARYEGGSALVEEHYRFFAKRLAFRPMLIVTQSAVSEITAAMFDENPEVEMRLNDAVFNYTTGLFQYLQGIYDSDGQGYLGLVETLVTSVDAYASSAVVPTDLVNRIDSNILRDNAVLVMLSLMYRAVSEYNAEVAASGDKRG